MCRMSLDRTGGTRFSVWHLISWRWKSVRLGIESCNAVEDIAEGLPYCCQSFCFPTADKNNKKILQGFCFFPSPDNWTAKIYLYELEIRWHRLAQSWSVNIWVEFNLLIIIVNTDLRWNTVWYSSILWESLKCLGIKSQFLPWNFHCCWKSTVLVSWCTCRGIEFQAWDREWRRLVLCWVWCGFLEWWRCGSRW